MNPGHYLIVPSTFEPNEEGEFLIRVFSESAASMEENDEAVGYGAPDHRVNYGFPTEAAQSHAPSYGWAFN